MREFGLCVLASVLLAGSAAASNFPSKKLQGKAIRAVVDWVFNSKNNQVPNDVRLNELSIAVVDHHEYDGEVDNIEVQVRWHTRALQEEVGRAVKDTDRMSCSVTYGFQAYDTPKDKPLNNPQKAKRECYLVR